MSKWKHIVDTAAFTSQIIFWTGIPKRIKIKLELINFLKGEVLEYKNSAYQTFTAVLMEDVEGFPIGAGDVFVVHFPYRTLYRAIEPISVSIKKSVNMNMGDDNVYIEFIKTNDMAMDITEFERRGEDIELSGRALKARNDKREYPTAKQHGK